MLYPDFNELIAFKAKKSKVSTHSKKAVKSTTPGHHHSPFQGQGLEFDCVREYVPGDDIRNIDWKVTARTGSPHLKLYRQERDRQIILCIDMNSSMRFGTRNTFKSVQAARIGALIGWQAISHQDRLSAFLYGDIENRIKHIPSAKTKKSLSIMLRDLSTPQLAKHIVPLGDVLKQVMRGASTGALVYIISDFVEIPDGLEGLLLKLNSLCDLIFISINDPADRTLIPIGSIICRDYHDRKYILNTDYTRGREDYEKQWCDHRKKLHALSHRCKIPLIELTTESDVQRELIQGLKLVSKRKRP